VPSLLATAKSHLYNHTLTFLKKEEKKKDDKKDDWKKKKKQNLGYLYGIQK
jgi:hypothetical protein